MASAYNMSNLESIVEDPSCNFNINTSHFSQRDLSLFIESIEIISRIEREKHERRQRRKEQKHFITYAQVHAQYPDLSNISNSAPSADEAEDEPVLHLEAKKIPDSPTKSNDDDETYFSGSGSAQSSPRSSIVYNGANAANSHLASDSEESGVFPIGEPQHEYENVAPLRPRSEVITKPKCRSTRSRIIGLVLKRNYTQSKTPSMQELCPTTKAGASEVKLRDRVLDGVIQQQYDSMTMVPTKKMKKKNRRGIYYAEGSVEERFLDKALRYLTL